MGTRERIVDATTELFRSKGYRGTSLADVGAAAHAPTGSLYHFFPGGKSALAETVLRESGAAYVSLFDLIADSAGGDPADTVAAFFEGAADVLVETDFIEICPIGGVAREMAGADESIRLATSDVFASWVTHLACRLADAGLPDTEASDVSYTVIAALEGAFVLARSHRDAHAVHATGRQIAGLVRAHLDEANR